ncbi:MAG TPA: hypothetical protein VLA21_09060 [Candidatus Limnocylindria bacterium]|nr:hypothetical protein [Candidatus Limnocylindria bacterium]
MKFTKEEKSSGKGKGSARKTYVRIAIGLAVLALGLLPMLLGGMK